MWSWTRERAAAASVASIASTMPRCSCRRRVDVTPQSAMFARPASAYASMPLRRPAMVAVMTWLPDASASARWKAASSARNSDGDRPGESMASSRCLAGARSACGAWARSPATDVSSRSRVRTMSATGKPRAATCRRMSALMPPPGVAMMMAPAVGPDPACVRTRPSTSSTRSASRTLERPTPSSAERARSPGRWSPTERDPSSSCRSTCSSTSCHARGVSGATVAVGARDASGAWDAAVAMSILPRPLRCGLTTLAHVVRPHAC